MVDFLRPPKSYCLKQWPSMSATKQNSVLQPVFEAFLLMRQDTSLRIHTYNDVNPLEDFRFLVKNLMERDPKYYDEFMRFLCTTSLLRRHSLGSSRNLPPPRTSAETNGHIPYPLFKKISRRARGDHRRANRRLVIVQ